VNFLNNAKLITPKIKDTTPTNLKNTTQSFHETGGFKKNIIKANAMTRIA